MKSVLTSLLFVLFSSTGFAALKIDFAGTDLNAERFESESAFQAFENKMLQLFAQECPNTEGEFLTGNSEMDADLWVEWRDFSILDSRGVELAKVQVEFYEGNAGILLREVDLFTAVNCH